MAEIIEDIYVQYRLLVRSNIKNPKFYYKITYTTFGYIKNGGGAIAGSTITKEGLELKSHPRRNEKGWLAFQTKEFLLFDKSQNKDAIKITGTLSDRSSRAFITIYQQTDKGIATIVDFYSINWIYRHENIVIQSYWDVTKGLNAVNPDTKKTQHIGNACPHTVDGAVRVAEYIVDEIKRNVRRPISQEIEWNMTEYNRKITTPAIYDALDTTSLFDNKAKALSLWAFKVGPTMEWDHKPKIIKNLELIKVAVPRVNPKTGRCLGKHYHKYKGFDYFYDVWSNIHYGYVGLSVGFDEEMLLYGSNLQQDSNPTTIGADTDDDITTMKMGFMLYKKFGKYAESLTAKDILDLLDETPQNQFPESKRIHACYDPTVQQCSL